MTKDHPTPIIPGYQIQEQLYAGCKTLVYRAIREQDSLPVVIKLLTSEYPNCNELLQFRNQYTISKNLEISGIIHPLSLETYGNSYILVMEDTGGISLREYITTTTLSLSEFLAIAIQLSQILHDLHQNRVIHKDIKPANILIHPQTQQVKLIDFSIASLLPKETQEIKNPNVLEGTLAYISPEQTGRMNRGIDYRSDFYALGVTFYELLTGELPFISEDPMELVHCHIAKQPDKFKITQAKINGSRGYNFSGNSRFTNPPDRIPQVVAEIVLKLIAKNAEDRYQSALGLKFDLEKCLAEFTATGKVEDFAIAQRDICDRFLIPEKLYGREKEVKTLLKAFERAALGTSEIMLVAGFSGIGKTAVINEVHKPITRQYGYFIKGKFDQFNRNIPLSAFVQAMRDLMAQLLSDSDALLQEWRSKILAALGENGQILIEVIPELEKIIGKQPPAPELSGIAAQNRFNALLQKFIAVFTTKEHPLVIFLDDLQWADLASLQLMKLLMAEKSYLLLLGAYRDNEVSPVHPLMLTVEALKQAGVTINSITLTALSFSDVNQLVADTLNCTTERSHPLTELIIRKTQGNPFFISQFLQALYHNGQITFNPQPGYWECDLAQINALSLTDDVVEFMAQQLQKLPKATQDILTLAACIGNSFDLSTLAIISEQSPAEVAEALWKALQEGLVVPQNQVYKFYLGQEAQNHQMITENVAYRFLHDRVQQAAYFLIPLEYKQQTHLKIGQLLRRHTSPVDLESQIFDIVNQLNYAVELITQPREREELAQLNLLAGKKAKLATAYDSAYGYFQQGIDLLSGDCWQSQYALALDLYGGAAEAACLKTDFETMKNLCDDILTVVTDINDQVQIYELLILYHHTQSQFRQAVTLAVQTLNRLGESFPETPQTEDFVKALQTTRKLVQQVGLENLTQLPPMQDRHKLAAMKILRWSCPPAYFAAPEMLGLLICRLVDVTLKYGYSPLTPFAFGIFSVLLNGGVGDIETGKQFGELAIALEQQQPNLQYRAVTYNAVYALSRHFYQPVRENLEPLIDGYQSFAQNGDAESCAYCLINAYFCAVLSGQNLQDINRQFEKYIQQVMGLKQEQVIHQLHIWMQVVDNLVEPGKNSALLKGRFFDIEVKLPQLYHSSNYNTINYAHTAQTMLAYLLGEHEQALANASATEPHLGASTGKFFVAAHNFYYSLSLTALYSQTAPALQREYLEKLQSNQEKMRQWAKHCPENFLHRSLLVEAEICRIQGNSFTAIDLYDRAIAQAKENKYIQEAALANELAAKFYLAWGKEKVAAGYMQEAYYCYARWGAKAKTNHLEYCHPHLLRPILQQTTPTLNPLETLATLITPNLSIHTVTAISNSSNTSINTVLDFAAVLKASQAISSTIQLNELLHQLTQIILQHSGGDRCALILPNSDGDWLLRVNATPETTTLCSEPLADNPQIPVKLIQYVKHTQEVVVIDDVQTDLPVLGYYLNLHRPLSVLCLPILNQGNLIGLLYVENRSTNGVFTSPRLLILNFLCTQAAISLENARLYQQAQAYAQQLEQSQLQIVQNEKMASLGNLVAGVAHEINNPIGFLNGSINNAQEYIEDVIAHLELYQQHYPQPAAPIQEHAAEIDLEFLMADLPKLIDSMRGATNRIKSISTSLRTFSRADTDHKVTANLHEGIDSTLLILKYRLKGNEHRPAINIKTEYGQIPQIQCFPGQLNQVFMNILANAIDMFDEMAQTRTFAELQTHPQKIHIRTEAIANQVYIRIRDNGKGISEEIKPKIFDHLFTTKGVGKGTGLGLAIARQIITEKHGGTIEVNTIVGEGTEFMIAIPIKA
ncbi:ATP-binding sensor histidine kinase [Anabaena sp. 4-3]|uniref:trifunctional serine/threonine-protein kinase/ATP-binding protein/sensor histidine kinase n=1 Tax=Anabaena sp. 4-3 TaxID=1811979 RepID=UPI00082CE6B9|nr:ATP-binding sensor histidine kinase [Anabaena sp. 4-3]